MFYVTNNIIFVLLFICTDIKSYKIVYSIGKIFQNKKYYSKFKFFFKGSVNAKLLQICVIVRF